MPTTGTAQSQQGKTMRKQADEQRLTLSSRNRAAISGIHLDPASKGGWIKRWRTILAAASLVALAALSGPVSAKKEVIEGKLKATDVFTTIGGGTTDGPLEIRVGADHSFQIFNSALPLDNTTTPPRRRGQIFPSLGTGTSNMGWFVRVEGVGGYRPLSSSVPGDPYSSRTVGLRTGAGTSADPYRVSAEGSLGNTGLRATDVVTYINGRNFFLKQFTIRNNGTTSREAKVYLGADIYLANSDAGIPYRDGISGSVGGRSCPTPPSAEPYSILFIPYTPISFWTADRYANVWNQIASRAAYADNAGNLNNAVRAAACAANGGGGIDNGAALQWNVTIAPGASVTILAATSFGEIPTITQFNVTSVSPNSMEVGTSRDGVIIRGIGFDTGTSFQFGEGITVSNLVIEDATRATATLTVSGNAAIGPRTVVATRDATGESQGLRAELPEGFRVLGRAAIALTKTASVTRNGTSGTRYTAGDVVSYVIQIINSGNNAASNLTVADAVPTGLTDFSWTCSTVSGGDVSCPAPPSNCTGNPPLCAGGINQTFQTFPAGAEVSYAVSARISTSPPASIANTVTVGGFNGECIGGTQGPTAPPCTATANIQRVAQSTVQWRNPAPVAPNPSLSLMNQPVQLLVAVGGEQQSPPSGTVRMTANDTQVCSGALATVTGVRIASCSHTFTTPGNYTLRADYAGDSNHAGSSADIQHRVRRNATVTLATDATQPVVGSEVTLRATITGYFPNGITGQSVTFQSNAAPSAIACQGGVTWQATDPVQSERTLTATCRTRFTSASTTARTITAVYGGDTFNIPPQTPPSVALTVQQHVVTMTLATNVNEQNPAYVGSEVVFTAGISAPAAGGTSPQTIGFFIGDDAITGCAAVPVVNQQATCTTRFAAAQSYSVTARYSGDSNNAVVSESTTVVVGRFLASITTSLPENHPGVVYTGQSIRLTATVSGYFQRGVAPGTVSFHRAESEGAIQECAPDTNGSIALPSTGFTQAGGVRNVLVSCDVPIPVGSGDETGFGSSYSGNTPQNAGYSSWSGDAYDINLAVRPRPEIANAAPATVAGKVGFSFTLRNPGSEDARNVQVSFPASSTSRLVFYPICSTEVVNGVVKVKCQKPTGVGGITCASDAPGDIRSCTVGNLRSVVSPRFFVESTGSSVNATLRVNDVLVNSAHTIQ